MSTEFHITIGKDTAPNQKAVDILAQQSGLSKQQIKQAMKKGCAWIEDDKGIRRIRRGDATPQNNSTLHFYYDTKVLDAIPPTPTLITDEGSYSIWNKPTGMLSQGSKWGDHCTLNRWIESNEPFEKNPQRNCFIIHRLDRAARGLMIVAHKKGTAAALGKLFETRNIAKHYQVIVEGQFPKEGLIIDSEIEDKPAHSEALPIAFDTFKDRTLLDINIKTGRKHQIRIHMTRSGHSVVGDRLHGNANAETIENLQLSSFSLEFTCPITHESKHYELPENLRLSL